MLLLLSRLTSSTRNLGRKDKNKEMNAGKPEETGLKEESVGIDQEEMKEGRRDQTATTERIVVDNVEGVETEETVMTEQ